MRKQGHKRAVPNRKRERKISRSVEVGIGNDRPSSGSGYIIIPPDIDRSEYINMVYRLGEVMIATSFNDVYKNVKVPEHLIDSLEFPETYKEYGKLVSWTNMPVINQVVLTGFLMAPDTVYSGNENSRVRSVTKAGGMKSFSESTKQDDSGSYHNIRLQNMTDDSGAISIAASSTEGTSSLKLNVDGNTFLHSDKTNLIRGYEGITLQVGTDKNENKALLTMTKDGVFEYKDFEGSYVKVEDKKITVESKGGEIVLGEGATESAMLGDKTKTELEKLSARVDLIYQAIQTGVPAAGSSDGGTAFKSSMVTILATAISENYSNILSTVNKLK